MSLQYYSTRLLLFIVFAQSTLSGCVDKRERPQLLFQIGALKEAEWKHVDKTCEYEAARAVAAIKIGVIATEQYSKLYILCAESKGATFVGSTDTARRPSSKTVAVQPYYWN